MRTKDSFKDLFIASFCRIPARFRVAKGPEVSVLKAGITYSLRKRAL